MEIKNIRKSLGLTQKQFALNFSIDSRTLQNWESGKTKTPLYVIKMLEIITSRGDGENAS